jgi:hypothetical protein
MAQATQRAHARACKRMDHYTPQIPLSEDWQLLAATSSPANLVIALSFLHRESPAERVAFRPESSNLMYKMYPSGGRGIDLAQISRLRLMYKNIQRITLVAIIGNQVAVQLQWR